MVESDVLVLNFRLCIRVMRKSHTSKVRPITRVKIKAVEETEPEANLMTKTRMTLMNTGSVHQNPPKQPTKVRPITRVKIKAVEETEPEANLMTKTRMTLMNTGSVHQNPPKQPRLRLRLRPQTTMAFLVLLVTARPKSM